MGLSAEHRVMRRSKDELLPAVITENGHIVLPVASIGFALLASTDSLFLLMLATAGCIYLLLGILGTVVRRGQEQQLWRWIGAGSLFVVGLSFARAALGIFGFGSGLGGAGGRNTLLFHGGWCDGGATSARDDRV